MSKGTILVLVAVLALGGCAASAPTSATAYPGRLLVLNWSSSSPANLLQLTSASRDPVMVSPTGLSGDRFSDNYLRAASPDGTRFVTDDGTLTGVGGEIIAHLPDWSGNVSLGFVESVSFSPDGKRLAYAERDKVIVYDLAAKTDQVLLRTPCATYYDIPAFEGGPPGGGSTSVCGELKSSVWIDSTTLFVWHFAGEMPQTITCRSGQGCGLPAADTYSIVTTSGQIIDSVPALGDSEPVLGRDNTIVFADDTWLDLKDARAGIATAKPLPAGALRSCLSSDGSRVAVPYPWRLVDIRTGTVQELGTPDWEKDQRTIYQQCVWSPDGQFLAVQDTNRIFVVPASAASGGFVGRINGDAVELIGWTP